MTIADLIIKMSIDGKGLTRGADQAIAQFRRIGKSAASFVGGALGVGAISAAMSKTIEYAGKINDLSAKLGVSTKALQEFDYAASQSGSSLDDVGTAITKLQQNMAQAMTKGGDKLDAFSRMGVSLEDLKTLNPEQVFMKIAKSMNGVAVNAQRTNDMVQTMGRSATNLLPAFVNGFAQAAEQAGELGQVMEDSVVKQLDAAGDQWSAAGKQLMVGLAPVVTFLVDRFNDLRASIGFVSAALGSLSVDAGQQGILKTLSDVLFPTKSFGGNAFTRAMDAGKKAGMAVYEQEIAVKNQRNSPAVAVEIEMEAEKKKEKRKRKQSIDQIGEVSSQQISTDSLTRIGLFRGPVEQLKSVADKQLSELKMVRTHMQKLLALAEDDE